jgi:hypothetical protein
MDFNEMITLIINLELKKNNDPNEEIRVSQDFPLSMH